MRASGDHDCSDESHGAIKTSARDRPPASKKKRGAMRSKRTIRWRHISQNGNRQDRRMGKFKGCGRNKRQQPARRWLWEHERDQEPRCRDGSKPREPEGGRWIRAPCTENKGCSGQQQRAEGGVRRLGFIRMRETLPTFGVDQNTKRVQRVC